MCGVMTASKKLAPTVPNTELNGFPNKYPVIHVAYPSKIFSNLRCDDPNRKEPHEVSVVTDFKVTPQTSNLHPRGNCGRSGMPFSHRTI